MNKKILILGASGFIGGYLVEEALRRNLDVFAGIRKTSNTEYLDTNKVKLLYPDIRKPDKLEAFFKEHQFDYIIHNIGLTKAKSQAEYDEVNVKYLQNVLDSLKALNSLTKLIYVSSLAAYGPAEYTDEGVVKESSTPNPVTYYGISKIKAEKTIRDYPNIPINIIRPTAVYGPREKDFLSLYKTVKSGFSISIGKTDQKLTFIYVTDLTRAILDVCLSAVPGKNYFVSNKKHYTGQEVNDIIKSILNKSTISFRVSPSLLRIIGRVSEIFSTFARNYPALNQQKVNELECKSWVCDTESLKKDLDFEPIISLDQGMAKTIQWNLDKSYL